MSPTFPRLACALVLSLFLVLACGERVEEVTQAVRAATTDHAPRADLEGPARIDAQRWDDSVWARSPVVGPRAAPDSPRQLEAERVFFLPLLNRTQYRLHAYLLRGFDRTLAGHAALALRRPVVDPELAWELALEAEMPEALSSATPASPRAEVLARLARRTGAGVVVWSEVTARGVAQLHAVAVHPEGDPTPWDGIVVELPRPAEIGLYDGPRLVVEAVHENVAAEPLRSVAPPPSAEEALEAALARAWSGRAAATREAELALADLAVAHAGWPRPLVELAVLRMTRAFTFDGPYTQAWLGEGPLVPRHLARLFTDLDAVSRARLDALDVIALDQQTPDSVRRAVIDALPRGDLLRAVHAASAEYHPRALFGLDTLEPEGAAARWLVTLEKVRFGEAVDVVHRAAGALELAELLRHDGLLKSIHWAAKERGDWGGQRMATLAEAQGGVARALAAVRGTCATAPPEPARRCREILHAFLVRDLPDLPPSALEDARAMDRAMDAWAARLLSPEPERLAGRLPDFPVFDSDPAFAAAWDAAQRLGRAADAALRVAEAARGALAAPRDLLATDVRQEIRRGRALVAEAAFEPAFAGVRRGSREEVAPYRDALSELDLTVPEARLRWLEMQGGINGQDWYRENYQRLVGVEPWNSRWVWRWIDRWGFENQPPMATARFLASILPRPQLATRMVAQAWRKAGEPAKAREILEAALAVAPHATQATLLDSVLIDLDVPVAERMRRLQEVAAKLPDPEELESDLAWARFHGRDYEGAEPLFRELAATESHHRSGCNGLVKTGFARADADAALAAARRCVELARDKWERSRDLVAVGDLEVHRGNLEQAEAAYREAASEVGGAARVVYPLGFVNELQGRTEEADRHYAFLESQYRDADATWRRAVLELRRGEVEAARERLLAGARKGWMPASAVRILGRLEARDGRLDRFVSVVAQHPRDWSVEPIARLRARDLGEPEGALAALEAHLREEPGDQDASALRAEIMTDLGRFEEAVAEAERGLEHGSHADLTVERVRALCGAGRLEEAREVLVAYQARWAASDHVQRAEFHILKAEGRREEARRAIRSVWRRHPQHDHHTDAWWFEALAWLRAEMSLGLDATSREDLRWLRERAAVIADRIPWEADAWGALARLHEALGETQEAGAARERMVALGGGGLEATRISAAPRP